MFRVLILIFLFCVSGATKSRSQSIQIDSLKAIVAGNSHDTIKVKALLAWDDLIYLSDPKLDLDLNGQVEDICDKHLNKLEKGLLYDYYMNALANAYNRIGLNHLDRGNTRQAKTYFEAGLDLCKSMNNQERLAIAISNMGLAYENEGNFVKAIELFLESIKIQELHGIVHGLANNYNHIGVAYYFQEDMTKAKEYFEIVKGIHQKNNNKYGMSTALGNLANIEMKSGRHQEAIVHYKECLQIYREANDGHRAAVMLANVGSAYDREGDFETAVMYMDSSISIRSELGDKAGLSHSYRALGRMYLDKGFTKIALEYNEKALEFAQKIESVHDIQNSTESLYKNYKTLARYQEALETYELFIWARDSIMGESNKNALIEQEYKYAYEKQAAQDSILNVEATKLTDAKIAAQDAKSKQQEVEAEKEQQLKYGLYGIIALVVLFGLFIFNRFRITKRQRDIIEKQKEKVDEAYDQLDEKNTEILDSINYAKRIQSAILPPAKLVKQYLKNSFILYKPKDIVAGDFYWMEPFAMATDSEGTSKKGVLFAAADCTGHGVPGAMVSVVCNNGLNRAVREYGLTDPGKILDKTREIVIGEFEKSEEDVKDGMDVALCSLEGTTLRYAGANNPIWIIRKLKVISPLPAAPAAEKSGHSKTDSVSDYELIEIKADKQPIGKYTDPKPYTTHTIELKEGDSFYIFSDGYADQFGGKGGRPGGKKFKTANFKKLLLSVQNETIERQKELIDKAFEDWKDAGGQPIEQLDDVCVIGVKI